MIAGFLIALVVCVAGRAEPQGASASPGATAPVPKADPAPAGRYTLDRAHASIIFRIDHLGFSRFTGRMGTFDVTLWFDPAAPQKCRVEAVVQATSLASDNPPAKFLDALHGPEWLDAGRYPEITFRSRRVEPTGAGTARIEGDFTMHGVTRPLVLEARFNGGYAGNPYDPHARIGFSAHGVLKRSDYGITYGLPPPGTHFGVGDEIDVAIEAELNGPAWHARS
jgi:polyisoprenoid-binding protein YceI